MYESGTVRRAELRAAWESSGLARVACLEGVLGRSEPTTDVRRYGWCGHCTVLTEVKSVHVLRGSRLLVRW